MRFTMRDAAEKAGIAFTSTILGLAISKQDILFGLQCLGVLAGIVGSLGPFILTLRRRKGVDPSGATRQDTDLDFRIGGTRKQE